MSYQSFAAARSCVAMFDHATGEAKEPLAHVFRELVEARVHTFPYRECSPMGKMPRRTLQPLCAKIAAVFAGCSLGA